MAAPVPATGSTIHRKKREGGRKVQNKLKTGGEGKGLSPGGSLPDFRRFGSQLYAFPFGNWQALSWPYSGQSERLSDKAACPGQNFLPLLSGTPGEAMGAPRCSPWGI